MVDSYGLEGTQRKVREEEAVKQFGDHGRSISSFVVGVVHGLSQLAAEGRKDAAGL